MTLALVFGDERFSFQVSNVEVGSGTLNLFVTLRQPPLFVKLLDVFIDEVLGMNLDRASLGGIDYLFS